MDTCRDRITWKKVSYNQLNQDYFLKNDKYSIVSYEKETRRRTFGRNPNLYDYSRTYLYLCLINDIPVGRCFYFPTKIKFNSEIDDVLSASSLEVYPDFRHLAIGADIIVYGTYSAEYSYKLFAGISQMALPLYKKMKYTIFELPKYLLRKKVDTYIKKIFIGEKGLRFITSILNPIFCIREKIFARITKEEKQFIVNKINEVPEWVNEIVINDGHKYMEVHDNRWLQWNLDNTFKEGEYNIQSFYTVSTLENDNIGFFMTKERVIDKNGTTVGTIVEWGSKNENLLSECSLYKFALKSFSDRVSFVELGTINKQTEKEILKWGFFRTGEEHILFKSDKKKIENIDDPNSWRLRLGYADTILS